MTFAAARRPAPRAVVAFVFAAWVLALVLPDCHVFARAAAVHEHIESVGPGVENTVTLWAAADRHAHVNPPERHLPGDALLVAPPRSGPSWPDLLPGLDTPPAAPPAPERLGAAPRAPPGSALPVLGGRDLLVRFGIDRN
ncbi:hypothetical protein IU469_14475 [Nocardia puris]|uniref:hypothetical protein n=1 Tax=Nocardia puris TaxID=208602 RepID=UPI001892EB93|nr:hypothetical protein [Nocardia puris]MBF6211893.1 hypothetical protein [Nocardia puris]MBF6366920.1 hypothetical protein [Nocardia puris]